MTNNNNLVPGFNDEKDDSLKISLDKLDDLSEFLSHYFTTEDLIQIPKLVQESNDMEYGDHAKLIIKAMPETDH